MNQKFTLWNGVEYEVTNAHDQWDDVGKIAYYLSPVRGRKMRYRLIRHHATPGLMYIINSKGNLGKIAGYRYFTDEKGIVEPSEEYK